LTSIGERRRCDADPTFFFFQCPRPSPDAGMIAESGRGCEYESDRRRNAASSTSWTLREAVALDANRQQTRSWSDIRSCVLSDESRRSKVQLD